MCSFGRLWDRVGGWKGSRGGFFVSLFFPAFKPNETDGERNRKLMKWTGSLKKRSQSGLSTGRSRIRIRGKPFLAHLPLTYPYGPIDGRPWRPWICCESGAIICISWSASSGRRAPARAEPATIMLFASSLSPLQPTLAPSCWPPSGAVKC